MSGGGGNSGQVYYENQDKLLGVQADIAQNMYNQYAKYAPSRLDAMSRMADEAMDGSLAERMRTQASADAGMAFGNNMQAIGRNMGRYGANFNPDRMASMMSDAALQGAAMKTGAMNNANQWAENQKWARNQDMYSALAGMPSNAVSALNSAASGYGQMGGDQTRLQMAGAQGAGQFGSAMAYGLMRADGGSVDYDDAPGYAMGGMPQLSDWRQRSSGVRAPQAPGMMQSVIAGAAPTVGMHMVGDAVKPYIKDGIGALKEGIGNASAQMFGTQTYTNPAVMGPTMGELTGEAATTLATDAGSAIAGQAAVDAGASALGSEALTTGIGQVAAEGALGGVAAGGLGSAALAAAPWLAGGLLLGNAMGWFADGGQVPHKGGLRRDFRPGGKVAGPGTETSDSIPAWLSDGEFVLNSEAVKQVGKAKLEKMNNKGLKKRAAKAKGAK